MPMMVLSRIEGGTIELRTCASQPATERKMQRSKSPGSPRHAVMGLLRMAQAWERFTASRREKQRSAPPLWLRQSTQSYDGSRRHLAPSRAIRIMPSSRFGNCRSVAPITHLHEQTFVAHAGQIAARNVNVGWLFRPDYPKLQGERERAFSEGRLRAAGQPNSLSVVAITLSHPDGGLWRLVRD